MPILEFWLAIAALVGVSVGLCGLVWARAATPRAGWGRVLCVGAIVFLGLVSVVAAAHRADGLVALGLSAGFLVVGVLWGDPRPNLQESSAAP